MEHEGDDDTNCNWCTRNNLQGLGKGRGRLRNQGTSQDHLDHNIIKIDQNTEKSPGDVRRLVVTQILVKKLSANAGVKKKKKKTHKEYNNKGMEHEGDGHTNCNWCTRKYLQGSGRLKNQRTSQDHPIYSIKIDQNTEKIPGDLRRLVVIPVKDHPLVLDMKSSHNDNHFSRQDYRRKIKESKKKKKRKKKTNTWIWSKKWEAVKLDGDPNCSWNP